MPLGTTAQNIFLFNIFYLNPNSFKFLIGYTKVSSFDSIQRFAGIYKEQHHLQLSWKAVNADYSHAKHCSF